MGEAGKGGDQASATTMVEVAISNTSSRGTRSRRPPSSSSSTSRPHGSDNNHSSRPHGSSSSSSSSSDIRRHNTGDRSISSSTPGPAGRDHPPNSSTRAEHPPSGDDIGAEISRTASDACVSGARRSISPQSAGQFRPHQRHSIIRTRHHLFQELMSRSTAPAPLPLDVARQQCAFDRVQVRISAITQ